MNIIIIGDGGIGSNLATPSIKMLKYLRDKAEDYHDIIVKIVDGDIVEKKNLLRQSFVPDDCGKKKADITAEYLSTIVNAINAKNITVESMPVYIKENNASMIEEGDIVMVGVDNYITRVVVENRVKKLESVFVIFGGNEYDDGDVNILHKEKGKYLTPLLTKKHPEVKKKDKFPDEIGCEEATASAPQLIVANMMVANFMIEGLHSFLTTKKVPWHEKMFDLKTGGVRTIR